MVMAASRIEMGAARRARAGIIEISSNAHFLSARSAKNCVLVPFPRRPRLNLMAGECFVAILAGVVEAAALQFYRDNIELRAPVRTACLRVDAEAANEGLHASQTTKPGIGRLAGRLWTARRHPRRGPSGTPFRALPRLADRNYVFVRRRSEWNSRGKHSVTILLPL